MKVMRHNCRRYLCPVIQFWFLTEYLSIKVSDLFPERVFLMYWVKTMTIIIFFPCISSDRGRTNCCLDEFLCLLVLLFPKCCMCTPTHEYKVFTLYEWATGLWFKEEFLICKQNPKYQVFVHRIDGSVFMWQVRNLNFQCL